jgi:photosystem II stability/assembly factor-like uncharacterized protein
MKIFGIALLRAALLLTLLAPLNAQSTWKKLALGASADLKGAHFRGPNRGYVVGDSGMLFATTDGGATWSRIEVPTDQGLWSVYASAGPAGDVIHVAGDNGTALKSTDGGATWAVEDIGYDQGFTFGMFGYDPDHLYIAGGEGEIGSTTGVISRSTDGGATWTRSTIEGTYAFDKIHFGTPNVGYAAASTDADFSGGAIYKTTDGGATWGLSKSTPSAVNSVYCFDADRCIAVGFFGVALSTSDGGATWTPLDLPPGGDAGIFTHVLFLDAMTGYISNAVGGMLKSTDGGATWGYDPSYTGTEPIWSLAAGAGSSQSTLYAVGDGSALYRLGTSGASVPAAAAEGGISLALAPNPLGGEGALTVQLPGPADLDVAIYRLTGERVRTLFSGRSDGSPHVLRLDGASLPAGAYYCVARSGRRFVVERVVIVR